MSNPSNSAGKRKSSRGKFPLTELGNARRLVAAHGEDVRYCAQWGRWLTWDGVRWRIDDTGEIYRRAKAVLDTMWHDVAATEGAERSEFVKHVRASSQDRGIKATISIACSEPGVPVSPGDLDQHPHLLNCPNGTIDLRTAELRPHCRNDLITKCTGANFVPDAASPVWDRFVRDVFDCNDELIGFVRRFFGYSVYGIVREHVLAVFHGDGANGKSTLLEAIMHALGPDYSTKATADLLVVKPGSTHPTERADLFGKRFVAAVETEDGKRLNESLVKELTGNDTVKARRMYEDSWTFEPTWKIALCTNHKPSIRGTDFGIWRRIHLVPFTQTFEGNRRDLRMSEKLRAEAEGILGWAVRGCLEWQRDGLGSAEAVTEATKAYRADEDVIGVFFADCCVFDQRCNGTRAKDLRAAYEEWATDAGRPLLNPKRFANELKARGCESYSNNGVRYRGIELRRTQAGSDVSHGTVS